MLFDLDGTLFDHEGAALESLRGWLPTLGLEASPLMLARWFDAEEVYIAQWRAGQVSWREQRRLRSRNVLPGRELLDDAELDALFDTYLQRYESAWRAYDDVGAALDQLAAAGSRLGVLTNGSTAQQNAKLAAIGLADRFEFVLTAEDLGVAKPDPITYLTACDRFGLPAGEVVHVGDVPDLDVTAPHTAELHSILIDRTSQHTQPDSLSSLGALAAWIQSIDYVRPRRPD